MRGRALLPPTLTPAEVAGMSTWARGKRLWAVSPAVGLAKMRIGEVFHALSSPVEGMYAVLNRVMHTRDGLDILALLFLAPFVLAWGLLFLALALSALSLATIWIHLTLPPAFYAAAVLVGITARAYRLALQYNDGGRTVRARQAEASPTGPCALAVAAAAWCARGCRRVQGAPPGSSYPRVI